MEFEKSSQAKSWIFSVKSLAECKRIAVSMDSELEAGNRADTHCRMSNRVRKFASGFHKRGESGTTPLHLPTPSLRHQEILVQFHAHQIQFLIGPNAVLYELRTSEHVLSTAIMFFRRFYMSNAVVEISPRKIAAACAFFAAKVEEEKVEIGLVSHATALIQLRVQNAPLCCKELRAVRVAEIEYAERLLMEGLNYEFRCYHAGEVIENIFANVSIESPQCCIEESSRGDVSPRSTKDQYEQDDSFSRETYDKNDFLRKALDIAKSAEIFTDLPFLSSPNAIAFAISAVVTGAYCSEGYWISSKLARLFSRFFPEKSQEETNMFLHEVRRVIRTLLQCSYLNLGPSSETGAGFVVQRAEELRRAMGEVASIRLLRKLRKSHSLSRPVLMVHPSPSAAPFECFEPPRKRSRLERDFTPPYVVHKRPRYTKITPTNGNECK